MALEYWARVRDRAWKDTTEAFGLNTWQRAMTKTLVSALAIILIGYFFGGPEAWSKLMTGLATLGAFSVIFLAFYCWNFFLAAPRLDAEMTSKHTELETKIAGLEATRPKLRCTINRTSGFQRNDCYNLMIIATVTNRGSYPSIFGNFRVTLDFQGKPYAGRMFVAEKFTATFPNGVKEVHRQEEHLGIKAATPVQMGAMTQGFLLCDFPDLPLTAMDEPCQLTLKISDILDNEVSATVIAGGSRMDPPAVFPGTKIGIQKD